MIISIILNVVLLIGGIIYISSIKKEQFNSLNKEQREIIKKNQEILTEIENQINLQNQSYVEIEEDLSNKKNEIQDLNSRIKDFKEKVQVINDEILRQKEIEQKQLFYMLQIGNEDITDLDLFNEFKNKINKQMNFNKLIYEIYISKPVKELVKRLTQNKDICGIYKVTNIKTKEIYIGKSTNIGTRWTNHIKSAFDLEGVADSMFQRALKQYGVWNFTWEILEETDKDKITEREKFWIEQFDTIHYGYNQRIG